MPPSKRDVPTKPDDLFPLAGFNITLRWGAGRLRIADRLADFLLSTQKASHDCDGRRGERGSQTCAKSKLVPSSLYTASSRRVAALQEQVSAARSRQRAARTVVLLQTTLLSDNG